MADLVSQLLKQLQESGGLDKIAGKLGTDQAGAQKAVGAALPAMMAGLAGNAKKPEGAAALSRALKDHDGSVLDDDGYFDHYEDQKGDKILGHVFGEKKPAVEAQVSQLSGLGGGGAAALLPMLAPLLMGFLGKNAGGMDAGALAKLLGGQDLSGLLQGGLGDLLGGGGAGGAKSGGGLGAILGKIFGGRR